MMSCLTRISASVWLVALICMVSVSLASSKVAPPVRTSARFSPDEIAVGVNQSVCWGQRTGALDVAYVQPTTSMISVTPAKTFIHM